MRPRIEIKDEHDVQDLLYYLLVSRFDDIRPEEPTLMHVTKSVHIDFLVKKMEIGIEVKMPNHKLNEKVLSDQNIG